VSSRNLSWVRYSSEVIERAMARLSPGTQERARRATSHEGWIDLQCAAGVALSEACESISPPEERIN
jgi:hypothetical protein